MNQHFKSETTNTMDSFNTLAKIIYYTKAGWLRIIIWVFSALVIAVGIAVIYIGGFSPGPIIIIFLGVALPLLNARMVKKLARFMAKTSGLNGLLTYSFNDAFITLMDINGESEIDYALIEKVIESDKYFFIFLQNSICHCIARNSFIEGNSDAFIDFLKEKCQENTFFGTFPGKYK